MCCPGAGANAHRRQGAAAADNDAKETAKYAERKQTESHAAMDHEFTRHGSLDWKEIAFLPPATSRYLPLTLRGSYQELQGPSVLGCSPHCPNVSTGGCVDLSKAVNTVPESRLIVAPQNKRTGKRKLCMGDQLLYRRLQLSWYHGIAVRVQAASAAFAKSGCKCWHATPIATMSPPRGASHKMVAPTPHAILHSAAAAGRLRVASACRDGALESSHFATVGGVLFALCTNAFATVRASMISCTDSPADTRQSSSMSSLYSHNGFGCVKVI